jgi:arylsulfatase
VLPIPDRKPVRLTTYDAKDPDTKFPPIRGKRVGEGRVKRSHALFYPMDETLEVGCDMGDPVSGDYPPGDNAFNGAVHWVRIDIDAAAGDADHLIGAEERFLLAMARQ